MQEPTTEYELSTTVPMVGMVVLNLGLFAYVCWLTFRAAAWVFTLFGPAQPLALAAAAAYLALALYLYSRPVNALQVHAQRLRPGALAQSEANLKVIGENRKAD